MKRWWVLAAASLVLLAAPHTVDAREPRDPAAARLGYVLKLKDAEKARLPAGVKQEAIRTFGLRAMALRNDFVAKHKPTYGCLIPDEKKPHRVRDQKESGRCWIYATDRVLRSIAATKGIKAPEMSTSFVNYHALRNQALGVLQKAAAGSKKGLDPDIVSAASEGGWQPWALDIIRQHGFVPKTAMDSSADAASSGLAVNELQRLVASAQDEFSRIGKHDPQGKTKRQQILRRYARDVDRLLEVTLGQPPKRFAVDGKTFTPKSYLRDYLKLSSSDLDFVILMNDPTEGFSRRHSIKATGMKTFNYYNVGMPVIEDAVRQTLRKGQAVYMATNVSRDQPYRAEGANIPRKAKGIVSMEAFDYDAYIPQRRLSKHDRLDADISTANHAMAITGFDPAPAGGTLKWLVENSWGRKAGAAGHWHMYEDFFRQYVEEVAVPRAVVPPELLRKMDELAKKAEAKKSKK